MLNISFQLSHFLTIYGNATLLSYILHSREGEKVEVDGEETNLENCLDMDI